MYYLTVGKVQNNLKANSNIALQTDLYIFLVRCFNELTIFCSHAFQLIRTQVNNPFIQHFQFLYE